jgi:hypothetical protein
MRRQLLVWVIVGSTVVAGAGAFFVWWQLTGTPPGSNSQVADGPTLYQALTSVNSTVQKVSGGPWLLFSYLGIAAPLPFNPGLFGFSGNGTGESLAACGDAFPGTSLWNASSIPTFHGGIASGTAPFWQFEFASSAAKDVTIATVVRGSALVFPPIAPTSPCWLPAGGAVAASYLDWVNPLPVDTHVQALNAYTALGRSFQTANPKIAEVFANGYVPLTDAFNHGPGGGVQFLLCGEAGFAGVQPKGVVGEWPNGTVQSVFRGTLTCTPLAASGTPYTFAKYVVENSTGPLEEYVSPGLSGLKVRILAGVALSNGTGNDAAGLATWMVTLRLLNSAGQSLPASTPSCQSWVANVSECKSSGLGWFAVLFSAGGSWRDDYPSLNSITEWSVPNVVIANEELLLVVIPASWNPASDTLTFSGSTATPSVSGSNSL